MGNPGATRAGLAQHFEQSLVRVNGEIFAWRVGAGAGSMVFGRERNLQAHGPRSFFARFAVAKKKPRNRALWLVECAAATDNPLEGSPTKGGQKGEIFAPKCCGENGLRCFGFGV